MKTFEVVLTKSYIVRINAIDKEMARSYSELFTDDSKDISTREDRKNFNFKIDNIDCTINEAFDVWEANERN